MSASKLAQYVGQTGTLSGRNPAFKIRVKVVDARLRFGHVDVRVEPQSGAGTCWVELDRVELDNGEGE